MGFFGAPFNERPSPVPPSLRFLFPFPIHLLSSIFRRARRRYTCALRSHYSNRFGPKRHHPSHSLSPVSLSPVSLALSPLVSAAAAVAAADTIGSYYGDTESLARFSRLGALLRFVVLAASIVHSPIRDTHRPQWLFGLSVRSARYCTGCESRASCKVPLSGLPFVTG